MTAEDPLLREAEQFSEYVQDLLRRSVAPDAVASARRRGGRLVVDTEPRSLELAVAGKHGADLSVWFRCGWDHERRFLAIESSKFYVHAPGVGEPLIRFDYLRKPASQSVPSAHVQVHAESTALGFMLARTGRTDLPQVKLSRLHIPVGGRRFRPSLEDVIELLVWDLFVDAQDEWQLAVEEHRERYKEIQLRAAIRDRLDIARDAIRRLDEGESRGE